MKIQSVVSATVIATLAVFALSTEASAADKCRRFIPSAGVTVEVPCEAAPIKEVSKDKDVAEEPATETVAEETVEKDAPPVKATKPAKKITTAQASVKPAKGTGARDAQVCGDILDRAERGAVTADEVRKLRTDCRK